jgi:integrase/recombinase XerD
MSNLVATQAISINEFILNFTSHKTRRAYTGDIQHFFSFLADHGRTPNTPASISTTDFIAYRDWMIKTGLSEKTVSRRIASNKSLMKWFTEQGFIQSNPASPVRVKAPTTQAPTEAFSDDEVQAMLDSADNLRDKLVLYFLFFFGLRRSELTSIQLTDIVDIGIYKVLRVRGKGGKLRELPFNPEAEKVLNDYIANCNPQTFLIPVSTETIARIVKRHAALVGVSKRISAHSCRATAITKALEQGAPITEVADMAGHSSINTTQIYWKRRNGLKNSPIHKLKYK